jgi:hypothetical protein
LALRTVPSERAEEAASRVMVTLAYGLGGPADPLMLARLLPPRARLLSDPRHSMALPHIVAIAEEFSRALLVACSESLLDPSSPFIRDLWKDGQKRAEGTWDQHRKAWSSWHGIQLSSCAAWPAVDAFTEARNAIMHGLGRLTRRQLSNDGGKAVAMKCQSVGMAVSGGQLHVGEAAVRQCAHECREFILWLDATASSLGLADARIGSLTSVPLLRMP